MSSIVVRFDSLRSIASSSITGTYQQVGGIFTHPMRLVKFVNNTNQDVLVSFDGTTDNDIIPANGFALYDMTTNAYVDLGRFVFQNRTPVFVKGTAGTGTFYVVAVFGRGE